MLIYLELQKKHGGWRAGSGRKKKPENKRFVNLCLTLRSKYQAEALKQRAARRGTTVSKMLIEDYRLEFWAEELEKKEKRIQEVMAKFSKEVEMIPVEEFRKENPHVTFFRASQRVDIPDLNLFREAFIPDWDTKEFPTQLFRDTKIIPISETSYPECLARYSAMQLGIWALEKIKREKWELSNQNIYACLSNLEMELH